jgi:hypothetical protein
MFQIMEVILLGASSLPTAHSEMFSTSSQSRIGTWMRRDALALGNASRGIVGAVKCSRSLKKRTYTIEWTNEEEFHFRFDAEFESNRAATIASLQGARYRAALTAFEDGMAALAKAPPDGKGAIRSTFAAAEGLFRLMLEKSPRLTAVEAQQKLEPLLQRIHAQDNAAMGAASKLLNAFKDWIDAAHFYRHEEGQKDPVQPPLTLAVQMVSVGASFIRWLAELDAT